MPQLPRLLLLALLAAGCASAPAQPAEVTTEFVVTGMTRTKAGHL